MNMSNKTYDKLKWVAQYLLPALGTLYFALSEIWGLPYCDQVLGTITALDTFLAVILGLSNKKYKESDKDGVLEVDQPETENEAYLVKLNIPRSEFYNKSEVTFKVKNPYASSQE